MKNGRGSLVSHLARQTYQTDPTDPTYQTDPT